VSTDVLSRRARRGAALAAAAAVALAFGLCTLALGAWSSLESQSVNLRFRLRPTEHPSGIVVVGIDDATFSTLRMTWPFPRSIDGEAVSRLRADGAKTIVYDVQFTEPTQPAQDLSLYDAIDRAGGAILATSDSDDGHTDVLGGDANLAAIHSRAARSNLVSDDGVFDRYDYSLDGIPTLAVATAERVLGRPVPRSSFGPSPAWIDYPGPPGTFPTVSFGDLVKGRVDPRLIAGKIVVIGATSATLQDVHPTPTTSGELMSGPEIQAAAIWSALHGNPLRHAPGWVALLSVVLAALLLPLAAVRLRLRAVVALGALGAIAYAIVCWRAFDAGTILDLTYPLATWAAGLVATLAACAIAGDIERHLIAVHARVLEGTVRERDKQLSDTELEIVRRLAHAAESRDADTGDHIERIGFLSERLGLAAGMSRARARMLGHAAVMHDVGKIGIPDAVLLKPARLSPEEWDVMRTHTTAGAEILAGSDRPIIQMAEVIARTHHERWDGSGYPAGLKGEDIPLVGRVCSICDVFDALLSPRPYKEAWTVDEALAEIERGRGSHFDPQLVDVFLALIPDLLHVYADQAPAEATIVDLDAAAAAAAELTSAARAADESVEAA